MSGMSVVEDWQAKRLDFSHHVPKIETSLCPDVYSVNKSLTPFNTRPLLEDKGHLTTEDASRRSSSSSETNFTSGWTDRSVQDFKPVTGEENKFTFQVNKPLKNLGVELISLGSAQTTEGVHRRSKSPSNAGKVLISMDKDRMRPKSTLFSEMRKTVFGAGRQTNPQVLEELNRYKERVKQEKLEKDSQSNFGTETTENLSEIETTPKQDLFARDETKNVLDPFVTHAVSSVVQESTETGQTEPLEEKGSLIFTPAALKKEQNVMDEPSQDEPSQDEPSQDEPSRESSEHSSPTKMQEAFDFVPVIDNNSSNEISEKIKDLTQKTKFIKPQESLKSLTIYKPSTAVGIEIKRPAKPKGQDNPKPITATTETINQKIVCVNPRFLSRMSRIDWAKKKFAEDGASKFNVPAIQQNVGSLEPTVTENDGRKKTMTDAPSELSEGIKCSESQSAAEDTKVSFQSDVSKLETPAKADEKPPQQTVTGDKLELPNINSRVLRISPTPLKLQKLEKVTLSVSGQKYKTSVPDKISETEKNQESFNLSAETTASKKVTEALDEVIKSLDSIALGTYDFGSAKTTEPPQNNVSEKAALTEVRPVKPQTDDDNSVTLESDNQFYRQGIDNNIQSNVHETRTDNNSQSHVQETETDHTIHSLVQETDNKIQSHVQETETDNNIQSHVQETEADNNIQSHVQETGTDNNIQCHFQETDNNIQSHVQETETDNNIQSHVQETETDNNIQSHVQEIETDNNIQSHVQTVETERNILSAWSEEIEVDTKNFADENLLDPKLQNAFSDPEALSSEKLSEESECFVNTGKQHHVAVLELVKSETNEKVKDCLLSNPGAKSVTDESKNKVESAPTFTVSSFGQVKPLQKQADMSEKICKSGKRSFDLGLTFPGRKEAQPPASVPKVFALPASTKLYDFEVPAESLELSWIQPAVASAPFQTVTKLTGSNVLKITSVTRNQPPQLVPSSVISNRQQHQQLRQPNKIAVTSVVLGAKDNEPRSVNTFNDKKHDLVEQFKSQKDITRPVVITNEREIPDSNKTIAGAEPICFKTDEPTVVTSIVPSAFSDSSNVASSCGEISTRSLAPKGAPDGGKSSVSLNQQESQKIDISQNKNNTGSTFQSNPDSNKNQTLQPSIFSPPKTKYSTYAHGPKISYASLKAAGKVASRPKLIEGVVFPGLPAECQLPKSIYDSKSIVRELNSDFPLILPESIIQSDRQNVKALTRVTEPSSYITTSTSISTAVVPSQISNVSKLNFGNLIVTSSACGKVSYPNITINSCCAPPATVSSIATNKLTSFFPSVTNNKLPPNETPAKTVTSASSVDSFSVATSQPYRPETNKFVPIIQANVIENRLSDVQLQMLDSVKIEETKITEAEKPEQLSDFCPTQPAASNIQTVSEKIDPKDLKTEIQKPVYVQKFSISSNQLKLFQDNQKPLQMTSTAKKIPSSAIQTFQKSETSEPVQNIGAEIRIPDVIIGNKEIPISSVDSLSEKQVVEKLRTTPGEEVKEKSDEIVSSTRSVLAADNVEMVSPISSIFSQFFEKRSSEKNQDWTKTEDGELQLFSIDSVKEDADMRADIEEMMKPGSEFRMKLAEKRLSADDLVKESGKLGFKVNHLMAALEKHGSFAAEMSDKKKALNMRGLALESGSHVKEQLQQLENTLHPGHSTLCPSPQPDSGKRSPRLIRKPKPLLSKSKTLDVIESHHLSFGVDPDLVVLLKSRKERFSPSSDEDRRTSEKRGPKSPIRIDYGQEGGLAEVVVPMSERIRNMENIVGRSFFSALREKALSSNQRSSPKFEDHRRAMQASFDIISDVTVGDKKRDFQKMKQNALETRRAMQSARNPKQTIFSLQDDDDDSHPSPSSTTTSSPASFTQISQPLNLQYQNQSQQQQFNQKQQQQYLLEQQYQQQQRQVTQQPDYNQHPQYRERASPYPATDETRSATMMRQQGQQQKDYQQQTSSPVLHHTRRQLTDHMQPHQSRQQHRQQHQSSQHHHPQQSYQSPESQQSYRQPKNYTQQFHQPQQIYQVSSSQHQQIYQSQPAPQQLPSQQQPVYQPPQVQHQQQVYQPPQIQQQQQVYQPPQIQQQQQVYQPPQIQQQQQVYQPPQIQQQQQVYQPPQIQQQQTNQLPQIQQQIHQVQQTQKHMPSQNQQQQQVQTYQQRHTSQQRPDSNVSDLMPSTTSELPPQSSSLSKRQSGKSMSQICVLQKVSSENNAGNNNAIARTTKTHQRRSLFAKLDSDDEFDKLVEFNYKQLVESKDTQPAQALSQQQEQEKKYVDPYPQQLQPESQHRSPSHHHLQQHPTQESPLSQVLQVQQQEREPTEPVEEIPAGSVIDLVSQWDAAIEQKLLKQQLLQPHHHTTTSHTSGYNVNASGNISGRSPTAGLQRQPQQTSGDGRCSSGISTSGQRSQHAAASPSAARRVSVEDAATGDELTKLSLSEKMRIFTAEAEKQRKRASGGSSRRHDSRYQTQPVTWRELESAHVHSRDSSEQRNRMTLYDVDDDDVEEERPPGRDYIYYGDC